MSIPNRSILFSILLPRPVFPSHRCPAFVLKRFVDGPQRSYGKPSGDVHSNEAKHIVDGSSPRKQLGAGWFQIALRGQRRIFRSLLDGSPPVLYPLPLSLSSSLQDLACLSPESSHVNCRMSTQHSRGESSSDWRVIHVEGRHYCPKESCDWRPLGWVHETVSSVSLTIKVSL